MNAEQAKELATKAAEKIARDHLESIEESIKTAATKGNFIVGESYWRQIPEAAWEIIAKHFRALGYYVGDSKARVIWWE